MSSKHRMNRKYIFFVITKRNWRKRKRSANIRLGRIVYRSESCYRFDVSAVYADPTTVSNHSGCGPARHRGYSKSRTFSRFLNRNTISRAGVERDLRTVWTCAKSARPQSFQGVSSKPALIFCENLRVTMLSNKKPKGVLTSRNVDTICKIYFKHIRTAYFIDIFSNF